MTALDVISFVAPCPVDDCGQPATWTTRSSGEEARVDCPAHPHHVPFHALLAHLGKKAK